MKSISSKLACLPLMAGAWVGFAAHAVQHLPRGPPLPPFNHALPPRPPRGAPAARQLTLAPPATRIAQEQHFLHWMMLLICTAIFVAVFSVMFYSIWKHRRSKGA